MLLEALRAGEAACVATFDGGPERSNGNDKDTPTTVQSVLPPHAALTEPGEAASRIYRVYSGLLWQVRYLSDGRRQVLGVYLPVDLVGTEALLWPRRQDAIETLTAATVRGRDVMEARGLLARKPEAALWLMQQILDEVRRLNALATALGRANARKRVAWFLLHWWERLRLRDLGGNGRFVLPLTQEEIGDCLGLTPVHVNRVLRGFREDGIDRGAAAHCDDRRFRAAARACHAGRLRRGGRHNGSPQRGT
jgi:CRP-like cAMP-binding protein